MSRIALIAALFSVACTPQERGVVCVEIQKYSKTTQAEFAKELAEVKKVYPTVTRFITDYSKLRDALRACQTGTLPKGVQ